MKKEWDDTYKEFGGIWYPMPGLVKFSARYLKRRVGVEVYTEKKSFSRILDVGCGNGNHVKFFAEQGFDVSGIDISEEAITIAKAWMKHLNLDANLISGDAEKLPYEDESFDVVVSNGVLDHVPFQKAKNMMSEIRRVLVPGGYIHLRLRSTEDCEFGRGKEEGYHTYVLARGYEKGIIQHYFDLEEIRELLEGFKLFDLEQYDERYPDSFSIDKAYLQSSGKMERKYIDLSKPVSLNTKYSKWYVSAEKE
ncbi:MAG: class I SAM-dependent methyltransferase [Candidatus Thorarchaeota archaeon]